MPEEQEERSVRINVETTSGLRFEADIPCSTTIGELAVDFFESQRWPVQDQQGRGQRARAVVELVNPKQRDDTKRLDSEEGICESGVRDGDTLRIFPEARAAAVDLRARQAALIADHQGMRNLHQQDPLIEFEGNRTDAPDKYEVTLKYDGFVELLPGENKPLTGNIHRVRITLDSQYPRLAPIVDWLTAIFHPNIRSVDVNPRIDSNLHVENVCLGVLRERFRPAMGVPRLVNMLVDLLRWRNYDADSFYNKQAADWAKREESKAFIVSIGGYPYQSSLEQFKIKLLDRATRQPIKFRPLQRDEDE